MFSNVKLTIIYDDDACNLIIFYLFIWERDDNDDDEKNKYQSGDYFYFTCVACVVFRFMFDSFIVSCNDFQQVGK